jgi:hypothetical protein
MDMKRRTFIQAASVGAAGLMVPQVFGHPLTGGGSDDTAAMPGENSNKLDLRIWGSCLYVFSADRKQVELAFFSGGTASSCHTLAHQPRLISANARVKEVKGLTVDSAGNWDLPPGNIEISTSPAGTPRSLTASVNESATACPLKPEMSKDFHYTLDSLAYVPRLRAKAGSLKGWRNRATTRIVLASGALNAIAPFKVPGDIAEMELFGPAAQASNQIVTDTTQYAAPLVDRTVTFSCAQGSVTYESIADEPLRLVLQAGPESTGKEPELKAGDRLPHWCALYSVFDKMPDEADRAELRIKSFCFPRKEREAIRTTRAARVARSARTRAEGEAITARAVNGPTPGDLCPGAIIILDANTE